MEWRDQYSIGVKQIDDQHKKLVQMIDQLQESLSAGIVNREVGNVLKSLVDYTNYHFAEEEALMGQIGYQGLENHKALHRGLITDVTKILLDIKGGKQVTALDLIDFLKHWLVDHILKEDQRYAESLRRKMQEALAEPVAEQAVETQKKQEETAGSGGSVEKKDESA